VNIHMTADAGRPLNQIEKHAGRNRP